ncbi:unnamed protein product [Protopolystoma xenopodis]|uniref:Uncharacterized protein n=1 Tax=Protopolystoma xenopodis TaxID=117903 RepID=A0A448XR76_9PLAT|nr:unnamed protein product [Protopolystoma xenopodis]
MKSTWYRLAGHCLASSYRIALFWVRRMTSCLFHWALISTVESSLIVSRHLRQTILAEPGIINVASFGLETVLTFHGVSTSGLATPNGQSFWLF